MSRKVDCCERGSRVLRWDPVLCQMSANWMDESLPGVEFCPYCGQSTAEAEPFAPPRLTKTRTICFDVDGVLCDNSDPNVPYYERKPYPWVAAHLSLLKAAGWEINVQTARYMNRYDGDQDKARIAGLDELKFWLRGNDIPFDRVWTGKCPADVYVDDRACRVDSNQGITNWTDSLQDQIRALS